MQQVLKVVDAGQSPFLWLYRFDTEGRAEAAETSACEDFRSIHEGYLWMHVNLTDTRGQAWLRSANLPADTKAALLDAQSHHQLVARHGLVWGVLSDFASEIDANVEDFRDLRIVVGDNFLITGRRHPLQAPARARDEIERGESVQSPLHLFEFMLRRIIDATDQAAHGVIAEIDAIEDRVLEGDTRHTRRRLGEKRRETVRLYRHAIGMHRVLTRFDRPETIEPNLHAVALRLLHKLEALEQELEGTLRRERFLHEEIGARQADEGNRQLYILTVLGTLLMPPTLVTGVYGMNVNGLPFKDDDNGFVIVMGMCALSSLIALGVLWWSRRPKRAKR